MRLIKARFWALRFLSLWCYLSLAPLNVGAAYSADCPVADMCPGTCVDKLNAIKTGITATDDVTPNGWCGASTLNGFDCFVGVVSSQTYSLGDSGGIMTYTTFGLGRHYNVGFWFATCIEASSSESNSNNGGSNGGSCKIASHSALAVDTLALVEDMPVVGAPFRLYYSSDRFRNGFSYQPKDLGLGGWAPEFVHHFNSATNIIFYGSGEFKTVEPKLINSTAYVANSSGTEIYFFDAISGRHLMTKDAVTGVVKYSFDYDSQGRLQSIRDSFNNTTSLVYLPGGVSVISPYGEASNLTFDSNGFLAALTNPSAEVYTMTYTSNGYLTSFQKPMGQKSIVTYDSQGYVTKDQGQAGDFVALLRQYDVATKIQTVTSTTALNRQTVYKSVVAVHENTDGSSHEVDEAFGEVLKAMSPNQSSATAENSVGIKTVDAFSEDPRFGWMSPYAQSSTYSIANSNIYLESEIHKTAVLSDANDPLSLVSLTTTTELQGDPAITYTSTYSATDNSMINTSPMGRTVKQKINVNGLAENIQVGTLSPVALAYDVRGRLTGVARENRQMSLTYDQLGRVSSSTDFLDQKTNLEYDLSGRVTKETLPDGRVVGFSYDKNGNVTSITPPGRPEHTFSYNLMELVSEYLPPSVQNFVSGNQNITYAYNIDKQLTQVTLPDSKQINLNYDATSGLLTSVASPTGNYNYTYVPKSKLVQSISSPDGLSLQYSYLGKMLASQGYADGSQVKYNFNADATIGSITAVGSNGQQDSVGLSYDRDQMLVGAGSEAFTRDANGLITVVEHNLVTESLKYNTLGEMTSDSSSLKINKKARELFAQSYKRDALGRIIEVNHQGTEIEQAPQEREYFGWARKYVYDKAGRLLQTLRGNEVLRSYQYDQNGNRTAKWDGEHWVKAEYDAQDRLIKFGKNEYRYDNAGNLVQKITHSHRECGDEDRKIKPERDQDRVEVTNYVFDSLGVLKQVTLPDGVVIKYSVDGQGRRVAKYKNNKLAWKWLYQSQTQIALESSGDGSVVRRYVYGTKSNVPDYFKLNGKEYRIISDQVGTPKLVVDSRTGEVIERIHSDEFGDHLRIRGKNTIAFGFAGGLYDPDTKLVHFGARDYDPETGRWLTKDPIGFGGGDTNLFGYVGSDPINNIDPFGTTVLNLTGDQRIGSSADPSLDALYRSLNNNPSVTVIISYGSAGGSFGSTIGTSNLITIKIDPAMQSNSAVLQNTLAHELTHASDIASGNLNSFNQAINRANGGLAESAAEGFANGLFDRSNQCP